MGVRGPGEPEFFADRPPKDSQDTEDSYALISRVPGLYGNGEVLYLSGNRISSITGEVQAFTDATFARTLVSKMKKPDGSLPRYYQVVLKVRSMDDLPIDFSLYALHRELAISGTSPHPRRQVIVNIRKEVWSPPVSDHLFDCSAVRSYRYCGSLCLGQTQNSPIQLSQGRQIGYMRTKRIWWSWSSAGVDSW